MISDIYIKYSIHSIFILPLKRTLRKVLRFKSISKSSYLLLSLAMKPSSFPSLWPEENKYLSRRFVSNEITENKQEL